MARTLRILALLALGALVGLLVIKMRASRTEQASLGGTAPLSGSFDTWPEVPIKRTA
jgi:hypothetical protein